MIRKNEKANEQTVTAEGCDHITCITLLVMTQLLWRQQNMEKSEKKGKAGHPVVDIFRTSFLHSVSQESSSDQRTHCRNFFMGSGWVWEIPDIMRHPWHTCDEIVFSEVFVFCDSNGLGLQPAQKDIQPCITSSPERRPDFRCRLSTVRHGDQCTSFGQSG